MQVYIITSTNPKTLAFDTGIMNSLPNLSNLGNLKDLQGFNPQVFQKLLEQQMEGLKQGKPMMPSSWGLGKPLTEEEFKKMRAEKGASVLKTLQTDGKEVKEVNKQETKIEGTIEEVLNRVREEKAKLAQEGTAASSHEDLRKKLKARLQAKQVRRMNQHAASSYISKKMPQKMEDKPDENVKLDTNTDTNTDTNNIEEIEIVE